MTNANAHPRRRLSRILTIGTVAAGAAVGLAVPAQAAIPAYHLTDPTRVVTNPGSATPTTVAKLTAGTTVTIDCGVRGRSVRGNTVWHHITAPVSGFVADYYTDTPGFNRLLTGEPTCTPATAPTKPSAPSPAPSTAPSSAPTSPAATPTKPAATPTAPPTTGPVAVRGATITYNEGYAGSCVFYALDRFHSLTGVYPKAFGDAKFLASGAAASGWTVSTTPRVDSLVVFQPGQNGAAAPTGHAGWVEQISGDRVYIGEMNAPTAGVITHRWLTPAAGVQYIYAA